MDKHDTHAPDDLANDLIWGVKGDDGIAAFLGLKPSQAYYLIRRGEIRVRKMGRKTIVASRSELRRTFQPEAA